MKNTIIIALVFLYVLSCQEKAPKEVAQDTPVNADEATSAKVMDLEVYNFDEFQSFLNKKDDKTYVINFWATWCAPCIKELPYFEEVHEKYKTENVEVILVSLDFPKQYEKKLIPFIKKKALKSRVIALNDTKMNDWIPKVNTNWSGAIPATIIYSKNKSQFYERSFTMEELENELKHFITH